MEHNRKRTIRHRFADEELAEARHRADATRKFAQLFYSSDVIVCQHRATSRCGLFQKKINCMIALFYGFRSTDIIFVS